MAYLTIGMVWSLWSFLLYQKRKKSFTYSNQQSYNDLICQALRKQLLQWSAKQVMHIINLVNQNLTLRLSTFATNYT
ncbi:hypothetical protein QTP88_009443 [Uroleucon formosanum]